MILFYTYRIFKRITDLIIGFVDSILTHYLFKANLVDYKRYKTVGVPYVIVAKGGSFSVGDFFKMNNGIKGNPIGAYSKCTFFVDKKANLSIGDNVGMSQTAIVCHKKIVIGNDVKIGGGVKIYDTDFHSLDPIIRTSSKDKDNRAKKEVIIKDKAFIGAFSIVLKGVVIGENSIVGAGSVVSKSIPDNQIWGGNPAKFIKEV